MAIPLRLLVTVVLLFAALALVATGVIHQQVEGGVIWLLVGPVLAIISKAGWETWRW